MGLLSDCIWVQLKSYLRGTEPLCMTGSDVTGSDHMRMRGYPPSFFFLTRVVQNVGTRDRKGSFGCAHAQPGFPPFLDMLCSTPRSRSHCVVFLRVHLIH